MKTENQNTKFQQNNDILVSLKAGRDNCLPYVLAPQSLFCESGGYIEMKLIFYKQLLTPTLLHEHFPSSLQNLHKSIN